MEPNQSDNANLAPENGMEVEGDRPRVAKTPGGYHSENDMQGDRPPVSLSVLEQAVDINNVIEDNVRALLRDALIDIRCNSRAH